MVTIYGSGHGASVLGSGGLCTSAIWGQRLARLSVSATAAAAAAAAAATTQSAETVAVISAVTAATTGDSDSDGAS